MNPTYKNNVKTRSDLMTLLTEACELEHGLACTYLYAAFSLKQDMSEGGVTWEQLHLVKKWAAQLYLVASQEMYHLAQAWNLLNALGGSPYYLRPNFPQKNKYYPINLPLTLEPFGESSIKRFIMYELPSHIDEKTYVKSELGYSNEDLYQYKTVGELYRMVKEGIENLSDKIDLFIGDPRLQIGQDLIDFPEMIKVGDKASAIAAISQIMEQGEGNSALDENCHYGIFKQILLEYMDQQRLCGTTFQPVRNAICNPMVHVKGDYLAERGTWITNEFTAEIADIFDDVYNLMLRTLHLLFSTPFEDLARQRKLAKFSIAIMPMVVKPLGDVLMQLPSGRLLPGKVAGPAFSMSRHVVLPFSEFAAHHVISERLTELTERIEIAKLSLAAPPLLQSISDNIKRLKTYIS